MSNDDTTDMSAWRILVVGGTLLTIGTTAFWQLPGMIQKDSEGPPLVNAFYCACITLTTVGYGDICPGNDLTIHGKIFLTLYAMSSLGFFCGPVMDVAASWQGRVPGGLASLAAWVLGLGITIFTTIEGLSQTDAIYASVITGTTIGYGDFTPTTDVGKVVVGLYAILVVNVMAGLLEPGRRFWIQLCKVSSKNSQNDTKSDHTEDKSKSE